MLGMNVYNLFDKPYPIDIYQLTGNADYPGEYYEEGIKPYINSNELEFPPIIHGTPIMTEIYLTIKYMEKLKLEPKWTLHDWWEFCRDYFCVVDSNMIDQYWPKYKSISEYWFITDYFNHRARSMQFADWLQLYNSEQSSWDKTEKKESYSYNNGKIIGWGNNKDSQYYGHFNPSKKTS